MRERGGRLRGQRFGRQPSHLAIAAGQSLHEGGHEVRFELWRRRPARGFSERGPLDVALGVAHAGDQRGGRARDVRFHLRETAQALEAHAGLRIRERGRDRLVVAHEGRRPYRGRSVLSVVRAAKPVEDGRRSLPRRPLARADHGSRRANPRIGVEGSGAELVGADHVRPRHLERQATQHRVFRRGQLRKHRRECVGRELAQRGGRELANLVVPLADEALQLGDLLGRGGAERLLEIGQRDGVRAEALVDRADVQTSHAQRREDEEAGDQHPDHREHLEAAAGQALGDDEADTAQDRSARQHQVVQQELELRPDLRGQRAAEDVLRGIVEAGLQTVADDEKEERCDEHRADGHQRETDEREDRQREYRVLHPELLERDRRYDQAHDQLHHVAREPCVAEKDGQRLQVVVGGIDEYQGHQVIADAARHLEHQRQEDQREHEPAARQVVRRRADCSPESVTDSRDVLFGEELLGVVVEGGPVQALFEPRGQVDRDRRTYGPDEDEGLGGEDRDGGGRDAGQDVADARARGDHRKDALALEQIEVLRDEQPELQHHELEGDGVDDVSREGDGGRFVDLVGDEHADRGDHIQGEAHAEGAGDTDAARERPLKRDHRPDGEGQDYEEQRVCLRAGLGEEDGLGGVEGGVHRPPEDHGEARDLQRAVKLRPAHVQELRQEGQERRH